MSIKLAVPEKTVMHLKPRISVIGVGGGGGNAVNNMIAQNLEGVDFYRCQYGCPSFGTIQQQAVKFNSV